MRPEDVSNYDCRLPLFGREMLRIQCPVWLWLVHPAGMNITKSLDVRADEKLAAPDTLTTVQGLRVPLRSVTTSSLPPSARLRGADAPLEQICVRQNLRDRPNKKGASADTVRLPRQLTGVR